MPIILQMIFSNELSCEKTSVLWLEYYWSLFQGLLWAVSQQQFNGFMSMREIPLTEPMMTQFYDLFKCKYFQQQFPYSSIQFTISRLQQIHVLLMLGYVKSLTQDCSISTAITLEILQSCTQPSMCKWYISIFISVLLWFTLYKWFNIYWSTLGRLLLTHRGRVTHICVSKLTIIGSGNGLSPDRRQPIIWTNAGILLIGPLGTNFSDMSIEILIFSFKKMRLKVSSAKRRPFFLGLNVLNKKNQLEMHECIGSTVTGDTLVLKHQVTNIHSAE